MRVMCVNEGYRVHPSENKEYVKEGNIYTVIDEQSEYSNLAKRIVSAYEFEELEGLYEKGMFIPVTDFDEGLIHLLNTKPIRSKQRQEK